MESELGRSLVAGETVHHRNGIKTDNRPVNLELWFRHQPYGVRATDLVQYVIEHHCDEVLAALAEKCDLATV